MEIAAVYRIAYSIELPISFAKGVCHAIMVRAVLIHRCEKLKEEPWILFEWANESLACSLVANKISHLRCRNFGAENDAGDLSFKIFGREMLRREMLCGKHWESCRKED